MSTIVSDNTANLVSVSLPLNTTGMSLRLCAVKPNDGPRVEGSAGVSQIIVLQTDGEPLTPEQIAELNRLDHPIACPAGVGVSSPDSPQMHELIRDGGRCAKGMVVLVRGLHRNVWIRLVDQAELAVVDGIVIKNRCGPHGMTLGALAERLGSGDGEGWTMKTRQTRSEPLPASVLFALGSW